VKYLTAFQALAATAGGFRKNHESAIPAPIRNLNDLLLICHVNSNFPQYAYKSLTMTADSRIFRLPNPDLHEK
jgi:hypothetical protein